MLRRFPIRNPSVSLAVALSVSVLCCSRPADDPIELECEVYTESSGHLVDDWVTEIFEDSRGRVWFSQIHGLSSFDGESWTRRSFIIGGFFVPDRRRGPYEVVEDGDGNVWFGGLFGLVRLEGDREIDFEPRIPIDAEYLEFDADGTLWAQEAMTTKLWRCKDGRWSVVLERPHTGGLFATNLTRFVVDRHGVVWVGSKANFPPGKDPEWEFEGEHWIQTKTGGPPIAPAYAFDGEKWRAFGRPHGLTSEYAAPSLDPDGEVVLLDHDDRWRFDGKRWKKREPFALRKRHGGRFSKKAYWSASRGAHRWVVDGGALYRVSTDGVRRVSLLTKSGEKLELDGEVSMAREDGRGDLWIGFELRTMGLVRVKTHSGQK